ncbi:MAG: hypothetical protein AAF557_11690 [Pseudomonadota bacterium]
MAMNDDLQVASHLNTFKSYAVERDVKVEIEVDSFDFGDRFDMDFDVGF